jgi:ATP-dependent helicase HepA
LKSPIQLPLLGFANPRERLPAFLVLVFGNQSDLWIQDGTGDGLLTRFFPCTLPHEKITPADSVDLTAKIGDPLLYGFKFSDKHVEIGSKRVIQTQLIDRLGEFEAFPFLTIDILRFIDHLDDLPAAIQRAKDKLASRGPEIAERWAILMQPEKTEELSPLTTPAFRMGDLVALRSNPATVVPILEVIPGAGEHRYRVFQNNSKATYYESQLQPPVVAASERRRVSAQDLQAHLTSVQILSPSTANLFSLRTGRVQFIPYQYRPVLKLIRSDRPRLLIADEVGVGKTIEAGLMIKELRARMNLASILIICPKALVAERKWYLEMKRFDESFTALDGRLLRHCLQETHLEGEWPQQYAKAILPFSLFDSDLLLGQSKGQAGDDQGLLKLDPPPKFDLVIVDEAHHIRNSETFLHQGVRYFCDNADAVVFLSATPVQLGSEDLFTLLNVLRPDLVIDHASFEQMAEPNRFVNEAILHCRSAREDWQAAVRESLDAVGRTEWGRIFLRESPAFEAIYSRCNAKTVSDAERVRLIRSLEELYTFSPLINRTRRRDIGEFTTRKPETLMVDFTPAQKEIHDGVLAVIARILEYCHGQQNVKFMMTTIRRQAASCLFGLTPLLQDILTGKLDKLELMEASDSDDQDVNLGFLDTVRADIDDLMGRVRTLDPDDPKAEAFIRVLEDKNKLPNNKALVFSTFRHTLAYLASRTNNTSLRFGVIHGDVPDDERAILRRRFAMPKEENEALDVLLSSEVGCEGLDFQFCDLLINYDLPWNPMRVEQRIGRIDRYGQKSATVAIVNLVTPGTVDADIYERCLLRIGVFQHSIGGNEEILGDVTKTIHDIAESFLLSSEEREQRFHQLADNSIRLLNEEQELESRQAELFGLNIPNQTWQKDIEAAESYWLSPASIQRCVISYLSARLDAETTYLLGERTLKTLRLGQEARARLVEDYKRLPRSLEPIAREWEKWLKGSQPTLTVTFDQKTATENPNAVHLSVVHPLVRQAAHYPELDEPVYASLVARSTTLPAGDYHFALYRWRKQGVKTDEVLVPIASSEDVENALLSLLQGATNAEQSLPPSGATVEELDSQHHSKWLVAQADHIAENRRQVEHRIQSLRVSHRARCSAIEAQIERAENGKIQLMKQSELARANNDFGQHMEELQLAAESGDIHTSAIVVGTLSIME